MGAQDPPQQAVAPQDVVQPFAVPRARPEFLARAEPRERPAGPSTQDRAHRVVEPDHGIRPRPGQVASLRVAAVHDPAVGRCRIGDACEEDLVRDRRPVWPPEERIELNDRQVESPRKRT